MFGAIGGEHRRVGDQRVVDARVRHQVRLELCEIDVQRAVEAQRGRDGGDDLADHAVQVGVRRSGDAQVTPADVVDGLVVDHEGAVRVLHRGVGGQDRVVRLDHGRRHLAAVERNDRANAVLLFSLVRTSKRKSHRLEGRGR